MNDRVALFLMDYKSRARLKILGHARVQEAFAHSRLLTQLADSKTRSRVERLVIIDVEAFDWNCQNYITPRYSIEEIEDFVEPLKKRIVKLEAQLRAVNK